MIICPKCEGILDHNDPSKIERRLCTPCVRNGALAEDSPDEAIKKAIVEDNKRYKKIKLKMEYIWFDDEWRLNICARMPDGHDFNITLSRGQMELWLEDMKELETPENGKIPPPG